MNGKKAKRLKREAMKAADAAPGYLGKRNRAARRMNKDGKVETIMLLGTIISHPESVRAKYRALKKAR
jgi:hypothetical protein